MAASSSHVTTVLIGIVMLLLGFIIGTLTVYLMMRDDPEQQHEKEILHLLNQDALTARPDIPQLIIDLVDPENIKANLKELTREPHVAGTARDEQLAHYIRDKWIEYGLDSVELVPYHVLLSHPKDDQPNKLEILGESNEVLRTFVPNEPALRPEDATDKPTQGFYAYSPSGIVEGDLVFAKHGSPQDYESLREIGVNLTGNIVLITNTLLSHATVMLAYEAGAAAVLAFPHPSAYTSRKHYFVYPNTTWLPGQALIREVLNKPLTLGDMTTPGYPAIANIFHKNVDEHLTSIPSQPLGYEDAETLYALLGGSEPPETWVNRKTFPDARIGPGFKNSSYRKVRLTINNESHMKTIYNVIGIIRGNVEPDRYVILGNHRDAWSFGAIDASGGTAIMIELARVFGELIKQGWRPRRTLAFASWTAEEYGLIGSTEWVEEKLPKLHERGVAYINIDVCATGEKFKPDAHWMLQDFLLNITKLIPDPNGIEKNLYDHWKFQNTFDPSEKINYTGKPYVSNYENSRSASDHLPFHFLTGMPYLHINWRARNYPFGPHYPTYHSGYDTFYLVDNFMDPTYKLHRSCGHIAGVMMQKLADSTIIPFNISRYVVIAEQVVEMLDEYAPNDTLTYSLREAMDVYKKSVKSWYERQKTMDLQNPLTVRMINDQILQVERSSTFHNSLKNETTDILYKNHIQSTVKMGNLLSGYFMRKRNETAILNRIRSDEIQLLISDTIITLNQAAQLLQPFHEI